MKSGRRGPFTIDAIQKKHIIISVSVEYIVTVDSIDDKR